MTNRRIFVTESASPKTDPENLTVEERLAKIEKHMAELRAEGGAMAHQRGQRDVDRNSDAYKKGFAAGFGSVTKKTGDTVTGPVERVGDHHPQGEIERDREWTSTPQGNDGQATTAATTSGTERL
jgi:hypothetical protein